MLHRQDDLHQTGDSGRRFQVADVRLDRADQQGAVRFPALAIHGAGGVQLDRVANLGARSVSLQVVHLPGSDPGPAQRFGDHLCLGPFAGYREPGTRAVLVEGGSQDHSPDPVAVSLCIPEPLQHHYSAALPTDEAVGRGVEGLAFSIRGQHPGIGPQLGQTTVEDRLHSTGQDHPRLVPLQSRNRLVHRHQRRGAGGVDRHGGPFQTEGEGDPPGRGVQGGAAYGIQAGGSLGGLAGIQVQEPVVHVADADVDPGAASLQSFRIHARVFQGLPTGLQHQPLLRVQELRLHRRDAEELRVEQVDPLDESSETAGLALDFGIRIELAYSPHPRAGDSFCHRVHTPFQEPPEGRQIGRAREPARHAHDRDRLSARGPVPLLGDGSGGQLSGFDGRVPQCHRALVPVLKPPATLAGGGLWRKPPNRPESPGGSVAPPKSSFLLCT